MIFFWFLTFGLFSISGFSVPDQSVKKVLPFIQTSFSKIQSSSVKTSVPLTPFPGNSRKNQPGGSHTSSSKQFFSSTDNSTQILDLMKQIMNYEIKTTNPQKDQSHKNLLREIRRITGIELDPLKQIPALTEIKNIIKKNQDEILTTLQKMALKSALKPKRSLFESVDTNTVQLPPSQAFEALVEKIKKYKIPSQEKFPGNTEPPFDGTPDPKNESMQELLEYLKNTELLEEIKRLTTVDSSNLTPIQQRDFLFYLQSNCLQHSKLTLKDFTQAKEKILS